MTATWEAGYTVWPVVIPLVAAACTMLIRRRGARRWVMEAAVLLTVVAAVTLLVRVTAGGTMVMKFGGWGAPFGITFVADSVGALLTATAGVVALAVAVFARADIRARRRNAGFDPLFLGMLAAVNGAFLTGDIFNLYVWFELMLVTAIGLMTIDRRRDQIDGALRYAPMSMMGATFILVGIALLFGEAGTLDMAHLATVLGGRPPSMAVTASGFLLLAGFALKAGMFPLFFWLPASYHTAPIPVTAALAGLLTKVAFYAMLRVLVTVFGYGAGGALPGAQLLLAILAGATMLVAVLAAIAQVDVRRLLSFHVLGQVAYLVMALAVASFAGITAAIFYTVHTMLVQTGLFLAAGAMQRASGSHDLRAAGGLIREHPYFTGLFAVLALSMSGVPPLSGFWAKFLVFEAALDAGTVASTFLVVIALVTGVLTLYSMSLLWLRAFWNPRRVGHAGRRPIPRAMLAGVGIIVACTIGIGIAVDPILGLSRAAAAQLVGHEQSATAVDGSAEVVP